MEDKKPPAKKRDLAKTVPLDQFKQPPGSKELPPDVNLERVFPNTIYFKDARLGESVMHEMKPRDKVNLKKMCRKYRCPHYRSYNCDASLCIEISGCDVDYILTGEHTPECTRLHGISVHNRDTLGADWIAGLPLDEQAIEMAKELATTNLSWSGMRVYQHIRNVLIPGGVAAARFPTSDVVRFEIIFS